MTFLQGKNVTLPQVRLSELVDSDLTKKSVLGETEFDQKISVGWNWFFRAGQQSVFTMTLIFQSWPAVSVHNDPFHSQCSQWPFSPPVTVDQFWIYFWPILISLFMETHFVFPWNSILYFHGHTIPANICTQLMKWYQIVLEKLISSFKKIMVLDFHIFSVSIYFLSVKNYH